MKSLVEAVLRARLDQSFGPLPPVEAFVRRGCALGLDVDPHPDDRREQCRRANREYRRRRRVQK